MVRNRIGFDLRTSWNVVPGGNTTAGKCNAISFTYLPKNFAAISNVMNFPSITSRLSRDCPAGSLGNESVELELATGLSVIFGLFCQRSWEDGVIVSDVLLWLW